MTTPLPSPTPGQIPPTGQIPPNGAMNGPVGEDSPHGTMHYSGPTTVAIAWSFTAVALIVLILRLYTRFFFSRNSGYEDWLILLAGVSILNVLEERKLIDDG